MTPANFDALAELTEWLEEGYLSRPRHWQLTVEFGRNQTAAPLYRCAIWWEGGRENQRHSVVQTHNTPQEAIYWALHLYKYGDHDQPPRQR